MVGISTHKITNVFWTFLETSSTLNFENRFKIVEVIEFKRFGVTSADPEGGQGVRITSYMGLFRE